LTLPIAFRRGPGDDRGCGLILHIEANREVDLLFDLDFRVRQYIGRTDA
jgi:hypothetical protein